MDTTSVMLGDAIAPPRGGASRAQIEAALGARLRHGWILDGAGPARYGWASIHPCRERWEGRTLAEIAARL